MSELRDTNASSVTAPVWSDERKQTVESWVVKHAKTLHLSNYEINIEFHDEPQTEDNGARDTGCSAQTIANYPYRTGHRINFYPRWLKWNEREQEIRVIHELLHIVTDPLYGLLHKVLVGERYVTWREAKEINEVLTDHLAMVFADLAVE